MNDEIVVQLKKLRADFEAHHISKKPQPTKAQTDAVKADYSKGMRCPVCGGWHHKDVIHLDYVGHAALTDRLLEVDPMWSWEPLAFSDDGLPKIDKDGGMWIKLTVCGVTRLGYGDATGKTGANATKEIIGDALRNAGMRFGCALDLWHKGILHMDVAEDESQETEGDFKAKPALNANGFKRALAAVKAKTVTAASVKNDYVLTTDQETALEDAEKEVAP